MQYIDCGIFFRENGKIIILAFFKAVVGIFFKLTIPKVVYDRVRKRKNYFEIPAFLQIERGISRVGNSNSKSNEKKNVFVYVFICCFEFSRSWFSSFNLKKGGNFKIIIFPFLYPIIYNPDYTQKTKLLFKLGENFFSKIIIQTRKTFFQGANFISQRISHWAILHHFAEINDQVILGPKMMLNFTFFVKWKIKKIALYTVLLNM